MLTTIEQRIKPFLLPAALGLILIGLIMRWYNVAQSDFVFYDEGYYLNDDRRQFVDIVRKLHPTSLQHVANVLYGDLRISLGSGKALWIFLINSRVLFGMADDWYFSRIISAFFGCLTLLVMYRFASRYYESKTIGILSALVLAILPGHVFYSRLGMQESLSTFCFLLGFYFYMFPRRLHWGRLFLSAFFFMLAYFSNYRLIVIPGLLAFCELCTFLRHREMPDFRKYVYNTLAFLIMIFAVGSMDRGQHLTVILPWMWHQTNLAKGEVFEWFNLLSYPYYTFRLETFFFGIFFWGSGVYYAVRKKWYMLYPFLQVGVQMLLFSFPEEKGARYICVVYPFMAMTVAALSVHVFEELKDTRWRAALSFGVVLLILTMTGKSWALAKSKSDYRPAMNYLMAMDTDVKVLSSQPWVTDLYTKSENVVDLPHTFPHLAHMYSKGYHFVILDPQAYVSWAKGGKKFNPELEDYLGFLTRVPPNKIFPHFNDVLLERFVLDHNSNLRRSIRFLDIAKEERLGEIRIYEMSGPIEYILRMVAAEAQKNP